jgi:hypothetical protein
MYPTIWGRVCDEWDIEYIVESSTHKHREEIQFISSYGAIAILDDTFDFAFRQLMIQLEQQPLFTFIEEST